MSCSTLYTTVQQRTRLEVKRCEFPIDISGGCHASYVYVDSFVYTIACPVEEKEQENVVEWKTNFPPAVGKLREQTVDPTNSTNASSVVFVVEKNYLNHSNHSNHSNFSNISVHIILPSNASSTFQSTSLDPKNYGSSITTVLIVSVSVCIFLSVLSSAVMLYFKRKKIKNKRKTIKRRPSSIMPDIVRNGRTMTIHREVRSVLNRIIKTICRRNGERTYQQNYQSSKAPAAPPVPPRPPREYLSRHQTLQYLRETNPVTSALRSVQRPHAAIQQALQKPVVDFSISGQRRADLLKREAALEQQRQERVQKSRTRRLERIVRLRELHTKRDGKEGPPSQKKAAE